MVFLFPHTVPVNCRLSRYPPSHSHQSRFSSKEEWLTSSFYRLCVSHYQLENILHFQHYIYFPTSQLYKTVLFEKIYRTRSSEWMTRRKNIYGNVTMLFLHPDSSHALRVSQGFYACHSHAHIPYSATNMLSSGPPAMVYDDTVPNALEISREGLWTIRNADSVVRSDAMTIPKTTRNGLSPTNEQRPNTPRRRRRNGPFPDDHQRRNQILSSVAQSRKTHLEFGGLPFHASWFPQFKVGNCCRQK